MTPQKNNSCERGIVFFALFLAMFAYAPLVHAQGFSREGVFGCSGGGYAMSVGTLAAIGGVYVPVNDAAVTLNTGYLVYKECTLDGVVSAIRESIASALVQAVIRAVNEGPDGTPQFVDDLDLHLLPIADEAALNTFRNFATNSICAPYRSQIKASAARRYLNFTREPQRSYTCSFAGSAEEQQRFLSGDFTGGGYQSLFAMAFNPANHPLGAWQEFTTVSDLSIAHALQKARTQLDWGQGFKPNEEIVSVTMPTGETQTLRRTLTPGIVIQGVLQQALGSGFRQLENANEIDQVVSALFSGMSNYVVSDVRGLSGLTQSSSGSDSYVARLATDSSDRVRQVASNAGLSVISNTLSVERQYNDLKRSILADLNNAASRLRAVEARCWELIVPEVEALAAQTGAQLDISTSTQFISGGLVQIRADQGGTQAAGTFDFRVANTTIIQSGTITLTADTETDLTAGQTVSGTLAASPPITATSLTMAARPDSVFSEGLVSLTLTPSGTLPSGRTVLQLVPTDPFTVGALAIDVDAAGEFSSQIINNDIAPLITTVEEQVSASDRALSLLEQIATDLQNSGSPTAQRLALERLDSLVANRTLHNSFDLRDAQQQKDNVASTLTTLVEDIIQQWGTGDGWCNIANPTVIETWFSRWRR